jgi:alpha-1,3-glucan synthase
MQTRLVWILSSLAALVVAAPYDERELEWNLNTKQQTLNPLEYSGKWEGHTYTKSPDNWRFPFYTLFLDRFVNGDPANDDINGTVFEHDVTSNQLRYGGDLAGLLDSLDYLQGMGIKARASTIEAHDHASDHHKGSLHRWNTIPQSSVQIRPVLGMESLSNSIC